MGIDDAMVKLLPEKLLLEEKTKETDLGGKRKLSTSPKAIG